MILSADHVVVVALLSILQTKLRLFNLLKTIRIGFIDDCATNEPATDVLLAKSGLPLGALGSLAAQRSIDTQK